MDAGDRLVRLACLEALKVPCERVDETTHHDADRDRVCKALEGFGLERVLPHFCTAARQEDVRGQDRAHDEDRRRT